MINSRIFSMTNATTNMLNTNILDILSNMNSSKIHANISIAKQFARRRMYRTGVEGAAVDTDRFTAARAAVMLLTMTLVQTGRRRRRLWRRATTPAGRRPVVEAASSRAERFPKPNPPSPVHDHKDDWFRRPALPTAGACRRSG